VNDSEKIGGAGVVVPQHRGDRFERADRAGDEVALGRLRDDPLEFSGGGGPLRGLAVGHGGEGVQQGDARSPSMVAPWALAMSDISVEAATASLVQPPKVRP
jgi:hypothetical protein